MTDILKKKINLYNVAFLIFAILFLEGFNLVDLPYKDIALVLSIIFTVFVFAKFIKSIDLRWFSFLLPLSLLLVLAFTSALQNYLLFDQPIIMGLSPQRSFITWICFYLSFTVLIRVNKLNFREMLNICLALLFFKYLLLIIQLILANYDIFFLYIDIVNERYGNIRLYVDTDVDTIIYFIVLYFILNFKNYNLKTSKLIQLISFATLFLFVIIFITSYRMNVVSIIIASAVYVIWDFKFTKKNLPIFIGVVSACAVVFFSTKMGQDLFSIVFLGGSSDTGEIRQIGRDFYMSVLQSHPLLGNGTINDRWQPSVIGAKYNEGIFFVDNGIFGFAFCYGLIGIVWFIYFYIKMAITIFKLKEPIKKSFIAILIYSLVAMYTLLPMGTYYEIPSIVIFLVFVEFIRMTESKQNDSNYSLVNKFKCLN